MINVVSVKWGTKYPSEEVNRLYNMVKKNLTKEFNFYCLTEDPEDLLPEINVIENTLEYDLEGVWNKLLLFKEGLMPEGTNLFFDIDVVIQDNIDYLFDYVQKDKLVKIKAFWKDIEYTDGSHPERSHRWDMNYNSSIMLWEGDLSRIWNHFRKNLDYYMLKYHGIDRFIFHEGFKAEHFPPGTIYSRIHGKDLESKEDYHDLIKRSETFEEYAYYYPDYKICIFNGPVLPEHYIGFEKYY